ncbi:hypothetical protein VTK73DRAFT_5370 [Phialemonium thermophilum]|uniref:DNA/RNA-binding domain-containing protein n=1 Tax=Phialemonium thermophilum TaxID=223376 RepID=A0ABR3Y879_9PEZI
MDIHTTYTKFLRQNTPRSSVTCSICKIQIRDATRSRFVEHLRSKHAESLLSEASEEARSALIESLWKTACAARPPVAAEGDDERPSEISCQAVPGARRDDSEIVQVSNPSVPSSRNPGPSTLGSPPQERMHSPTSSLRRGGARVQTSPKRQKARPLEDSSSFSPRPPQKGTLWMPGDELPKAQRQKPVRGPASSHPKVSRQGGLPQSTPSSPSSAYNPAVGAPTDVLLKQPETKPISSDQLVAEVKGIYAGLVMVERKCVEVDTAQAQNTQNVKLNSEQWQALIALHRTLLYEHHDFFLASQHPSASPALKRLPAKYAMPARMWRHGIHSFLEILRSRLPESLEYMYTFIYIAYSTMALLYETVPAFEDTWIECLGDLGRYKMAIETSDSLDKEVWTSVSRHWYSKASDKSPSIGRLYHHQAILARPNVLKQLFFYTKSLCVAIPFESTRESIMTLFTPVLSIGPDPSSRIPVNELAFVCCHGVLFSQNELEKFDLYLDEFAQSLDSHIGRITRAFLESGYYMGIAICCGIVGYCDFKSPAENPVYKAIKYQQQTEEQNPVEHPMTESTGAAAPKQLTDALRLANRAHEIIFRRFRDINTLSYVHVILVFLRYIVKHHDAIQYVAAGFPWKLLSLWLNSALLEFNSSLRIEEDVFPKRPDGTPARPLPEDWALRGLLWAETFFPRGWFDENGSEDDERYFEKPSMTEERKERILFLSYRLVVEGSNSFLTYDAESRQFSVSPQFDIEVAGVPTPGIQTVRSTDSDGDNQMEDA